MAQGSSGVDNTITPQKIEVNMFTRASDTAKSLAGRPVRWIQDSKLGQWMNNTPVGLRTKGALWLAATATTAVLGVATFGALLTHFIASSFNITQIATLKASFTYLGIGIGLTGVFVAIYKMGSAARTNADKAFDDARRMEARTTLAQIGETLEANKA